MTDHPHRLVRRPFARLHRSAAAAAILVLAFARPAAAEPPHDAGHYRRLGGDSVQCQLCPRRCRLADGATGYCRVRRNTGGKLVSLVYGRPCATNVDPIEKKPLYHFLPGSQTLSLATVGCSMRCLFCQNWDISQAEPGDFDVAYVPPDLIAQRAEDGGLPSISYTYSEPAVFFEYLYDIAATAKRAGIRNVMITSGHINPGPLAQLCAVLDAANVDLKGFSDDAYGRMANTRLAPILEAVRVLKSRGIWLELGYLVIPSVNDDPREIGALCRWVADSLGPDVPLHFLRFFPQHKLAHLPPTPAATLDSAYAIARRAGIRYVYLGNLPGHRGSDTYCHRCGKLLIERRGHIVQRNAIKNGRCPSCRTRIPGRW
ncbi:MAG: AmmeMemoRadiSam system radical SAM enzyme [Candidatus Edwardsbacteria bacterium]|jgi:pyruvate formate lyase activating enzyme|nr:AmmeMemoRadiSam system radical SAM enzyme [Candidatus Edwardsbacteria bacterium]